MPVRNPLSRHPPGLPSLQSSCDTGFDAPQRGSWRPLSYQNGLSVTSVRDRTASAALWSQNVAIRIQSGHFPEPPGIEDDLSDSYAARKIALGYVC